MKDLEDEPLPYEDALLVYELAGLRQKFWLEAAELLLPSNWAVPPLSTMSAALDVPAVHDCALTSARTVAALDASMSHVAALTAALTVAALDASMSHDRALTDVSISAAPDALICRSALFNSTSSPRIFEALEASSRQSMRLPTGTVTVASMLRTFLISGSIVIRSS